jgi:hypothetical protein
MITHVSERLAAARAEAAAPYEAHPHYYAAASRPGAAPAARAIALLAAEVMTTAARPGGPVLCAPRLPSLLAELGELAEISTATLFELAVAVEASGALARRAVVAWAHERCYVGPAAGAARALVRDHLLELSSQATGGGWAVLARAAGPKGDR